MREQAMMQKVGNRSGLGGRARAANAGQKPARRGRASGEGLLVRARQLATYIPAALKISLVIAVGVLVFLGYRAAAAASFFQVRHIETRGVSRASNAAIQATIKHDVTETGVWRADLTALNQHLEALPWVRTAVVSRVLPDGIRVRITEREPKAVVRLASGHFIWVDDDAVSLGEMTPTDQMPPFFLRGWNEDNSSEARVENHERIKKFLELENEWNAAGLAERVSELNLLDVRDVRAQLAGDDSQIEIRLGAEDQGQRLRKALTVLDKERQTPRGPFISYVDLTMGSRALVGLVSGGRALSSASDNEDGPMMTTEPIARPGADKKPKDKDPKTTAAKKTGPKRT